MRFILIAILTITTLGAGAQSFSGKTNHVNLKLDGTQKGTDLPTISWTRPQREYTNSQQGNVDIEANVASTLSLKEIKLVIISPDKSEKIKNFTVPDNSFSFVVKQAINLQDGQYTIKVVAANLDGGQVSSSRSLIIGKDAISDAIAIDRKDYALLIATDKYDYWGDLVNPIEDAHSIADILREKYGFETEVLENPNHEDVFIKIAEYLQKKYKPQDQLLIFFAGHGYFDDTFGEGFVVARNSLENDPSRTTYISHSRLRSAIENIPCEHVLLAMDVCFGGTFDPLIAKERGAPGYSETTDNEYLVRKLSYRTRKYLTSGGKTYVSDGVAGKHSPFAVRIIQALKDGGGADKILSLPELKSYVEKLTPEPRSGSFGTDNPASDFVFVGKQ